MGIDQQRPGAIPPLPQGGAQKDHGRARVHGVLHDVEGERGDAARHQDAKVVAYGAGGGGGWAGGCLTGYV